MNALAEALFTTTQRRLLALLYGEPDRSYYLKEILRAAGMGVGTVKRELSRMVEAGMVSQTKRGNQHHYQANKSCPIYPELAGLVMKTIGLAEALRRALSPLADRIEWAFIFGSVANGKASVGSDVDLLVIGDLKYDELSLALYPAQEAIGREINPKLYRPDEWAALSKSGNSFIENILSNARIDLIGRTP
ncbi:nucleotidyltransferase domain-containing protein [Wenzhouxiangella limi]|uniref:Transcriptional regulator n=1 Tax=Wenzhouxiangella limi TaxID=2707351 RepID=A0A845V0L0_9GAMM|nr:nucleotidyltransferase domain-containing protein [Wenzhouxiangella limi]NDY96264.1 transcriptional regulator [Wenzhouxiangella limi]